ncbi:carboxypeptidase-like regulatory domain-containing protein [uncultured Paludibaculum sp.]|uniref:carboxypeptidase-like regulatory domain-containing protein n=1 Tax=uncultured Paludibaculum sp. TaxID=1765020 RepID=UPI002AAA8AF2|nr:carboxypeptidase-like regulatory domain-containing protein [uncultured Paludibaculum sp.]
MSILRIPIDASQIADADRKQQKVKVAVQDRKGIKSQIIALDAGKGEVKLDVDPKQTLSIAVGPATASDEDIFHLQTLTSKVSPTQWGTEKTLAIPALVITPQWWVWWLRWCRTFTIHGRVVCADGSPVPGAEVRAYDVDFFWWWSSVNQVGPAVVTDGAGNFSMTFRWCCGWWPWWWWRLRQWRLDDDLIEKIRPVLKLNPAIRFPEPDPIPTLDIAALNPQPLPPGPGPVVVRPPVISRPVLNPNLLAQKILDPSTIPAVRDKLVAVLPHVPELEKLRIWPWWPWNPWFDCNPDIIFRVTQPCGSGPAKVIVSENVFQTRWDIPTNLNVTLVANSEACCLPHDGDQPEGDCSLFTSVCGDPGIPVTSIGKVGVTAGYFNPGGRDRPFSESVSFYGLFGTSAQADFYEIEYTPHGAAAWTPVPSGSLIDLWRGYFDATLAWPNQFVFPSFPVKDFGGIHVYESRQHYEVTHPAAWGNAIAGRVWSNNINVMANIQTKGFFSDGAYDFRVVGYRADAAGDLDPATRKVMDGCGGNDANNLLTLRLDNRVVGPQVPNTVHVDTTEPDCGINSVRIGGVAVLPCGAQQLQHGVPLEIDFFATDPDGHLDHYELVVKYDLGSIKNLLSVADVGAFTLTPLAGGPQGPDYSNAVNLPQTAVRPTWNGGTMRLHINDAALVFPKTCCYLLELTVWKRNIANCDGHLSYYNQMHYSFTVTV